MCRKEVTCLSRSLVALVLLSFLIFSLSPFVSGLDFSEKFLITGFWCVAEMAQ